MKNESLKTWANQELNGYPDPKVVPEYRIIPAGATGIFNAGYAFPTITRSIPPGAMEEGHRYVAREVRLCEPVSAYENALKAGKEYVFRYDWPADILAHYQAEFIERHALTHAWQEVPFGAIAGMLDTIRTRVLNVALDIEREIGETDADLKKVPDSSHTVERVNHIVINHIYSGTVFQGDHQTVNVQNINVGNWEDLGKALKSRRIQDTEIAELSRAIDEDGKALGGKVQGWIGRNAAKVWDHGLQLGTSVGTAVLTEYVKKHLGLP
jgi:hypothetical protein